MTGVTVVATASIVWLAYKWPRGVMAQGRAAGSDAQIEESTSRSHAA